MSAFKKTAFTFHKDELPLSPAPQDLEGDGDYSEIRAIDPETERMARGLFLGTFFGVLLWAVGYGIGRLAGWL